MGKTNQPLTIMCLDEETFADFAHLIEKGHTVTTMSTSPHVDVFVGRRAHIWADGMAKMTETLLKRCRKRKKDAK